MCRHDYGQPQQVDVGRSLITFVMMLCVPCSFIVVYLLDGAFRMSQNKFPRPLLQSTPRRTYLETFWGTSGCLESKHCQVPDILVTHLVQKEWATTISVVACFSCPLFSGKPNGLARGCHALDSVPTSLISETVKNTYWFGVPWVSIS